jgi:hypothetical protein
MALSGQERGLAPNATCFRIQIKAVRREPSGNDRKVQAPSPEGSRRSAQSRWHWVSAPHRGFSPQAFGRTALEACGVVWAGGFWPRKTQKDAELEGTVRGRGLLEAGAAEAAWGCLGKSVGWRAMAPLFGLKLKRYGASRPVTAGGCCGRQIPQSHAKCARHR